MPRSARLDSGEQCGDADPERTRPRLAISAPSLMRPGSARLATASPSAPTSSALAPARAAFQRTTPPTLRRRLGEDEDEDDLWRNRDELGGSLPRGDPRRLTRSGSMLRR